MSISNTPEPAAQQLSIADAAHVLQCSVITIRRALRAGRLKAIRYSSTLVRIERSELEAFIANARVN